MILSAIIALVVVVMMSNKKNKKTKPSYGLSEYPYTSFDDSSRPTNPTMDSGGGGFVNEDLYKAY